MQGELDRITAIICGVGKLSHLGPDTLTTTLKGPTTFYAAATYGASGLALLLVNANISHAVSLSLGAAGIAAGALLHIQQWTNSTKGPTNSTLTLSGSVRIPALSITVITVGLGGLLGAVPAAPAASGGGSVGPASVLAMPDSAWNLASEALNELRASA